MRRAGFGGGVRASHGTSLGAWLRLGWGTILALAWISAAPARAADSPSRPLLVGYFPQWGVYNQYFVENLIASGAAPLLDQIDYSQGVIRDNRCAIADLNADLSFVHTAAQSVDGKADDPNAPLRGNFHQLQELRRRYPRLKVLLSIEGNPKFFASAAQPRNRAAFVASCVEMFVRGHFAPGVDEGVGGGRIFDGFDLDWEYPAPADKDNYTALLAEFRRQLEAFHAGLKLTVALGPGPNHYRGVDLKKTAALVDEINLMNYDYNGPWSHTTGLIAPLREVPGDPLHGNNIEATIEAYEQAGVPPAKLLLGIPFYAYGWSGVGAANHGLFQPGQPIRGEHFYRSIQTIAAQSTLYRDTASQSPWLYDGKSFWTFDDPVSIRAKLDFARRRKLGGAMVWELSNDSADAALLKAVAAGLRR